MNDAINKSDSFEYPQRKNNEQQKNDGNSM